MWNSHGGGVRILLGWGHDLLEKAYDFCHQSAVHFTAFQLPGLIF